MASLLPAPACSLHTRQPLPLLLGTLTPFPPCFPFLPSLVLCPTARGAVRDYIFICVFICFVFIRPTERGPSVVLQLGCLTRL